VYQALLTRRYLTTKVMPLLAVGAVMLCTAMVLITWSVMGGFLVMLLSSGRVLVGDVTITHPNRGIGLFEDLIERLRADPAVAAATPVIEAYGLISLPPADRVETVRVLGIDPVTYDAVTGYGQTLWWRPIDRPARKDREGRDPRLRPDLREALTLYLRAGQTLDLTDRAGRTRPAIVLGSALSPYNERTPEGFIEPRFGELLLGREVRLSVLPIDTAGRTIEPVVRVFPVGNEFRSGLYEVDRNLVIVPLRTLQAMLRMDRAVRVAPGAPGTRFSERTGEPEDFGAHAPAGIEPARATGVLVRAAEGTGVNTLRDRCREVYAGFAAEHADEPSVPPAQWVDVRTWEEHNARLIAAVRKETALVLFLFGLVSLTAVFLVLAIFWSMVSERTRDVGVLRAIGASRTGIAWIWVRYGLAIGVAGAALGGVASVLIVWNINPIHEWLGRHLGLVVWDPSVYYFSEIPSDINPAHAAVVLALGVFSSVLGSLAPAWRAASMPPVRALRFE
jgi:lipoprotein-releasing system permease protein